jgi:DNA-binding IclR family transcriptional regulator
VTDVDVRLPAQLAASGRAVLAASPAAQVRALFGDTSAFVDRHGRGPASLSALRRVLVDVRRRGYAVEDGEVTPGFASVATAVLDHTGRPVAGVAVTFESGPAPDRLALATTVRSAAEELGRRIGGGAVAVPADPAAPSVPLR